LLARDVILPSLGFSEIDDLSGYSNQFFIDFIATLDGERVLVDATIKLDAYVPEKAHLAKSLRMKLFILHVSIKSDGLFYLDALGDKVVSKVPASYINSVGGRDPLAEYRNRGRAV
jgi:hypothetical protein